MKILLISLLAINLSWFDGWTRQDDASLVKKSFAVQTGGTLQVDVEPGAVELNVWDKNEVYVEADGVDDRHPEKLRMTQSGNTVRVEYRDRRHNVGGLKFTISVPSAFNADISTSGGSVTQEGTLTGELKSKSGGGSVRVDHIVGQTDVETGGGSVKVQKVEGDAHVRTGGGSIDVKSVSGELEVKTGGGSIKVEEVGKKLRLTTGGGSIRLGDIGAQAEATTGGGSIEVGKVKSALNLSTGGGSVQVRGAGDRVKIHTGGGSVTAEDIHGNLDIKTGGGSIRAELFSVGTGESTLHSGGGDVMLTIPENSKAEITAHVERSSGFWSHPKKIDVRSDFQAKSYKKDDEGEEINATYVLNGGGERIDIETTNGVIEIRKK